MNDYQNDNDIKTESLTAKISMRLLRWWGMLFRVLFITSIGIIWYLWMNPQPFGDVPLGQLTLGQIGRNISAFVIPIMCFVWLFKLNRTYEEESMPYEEWGQLGGWAVALGIGAFAWFTK